MGTGVTFTARGHPNIRATHPRTFEFTKDSNVTLRGDCIVGVAATFTPEQLRPLLREERVKITISCGTLQENITAMPNPEFSHHAEFVVRIGNFCSDRTFAMRADRAAADFSAAMRRALQNPQNTIAVAIAPR